MRTTAGPLVLLAGAALTSFASCNPRVQVGNGCGGSGEDRAFCVSDDVPPEPPWTQECFGGGGFCSGPEDSTPPPPPACKKDGFSEMLTGSRCFGHRQDPWKGGEKCSDARDCESVCCLQDERGRWVASNGNDAGTPSDASADADADGGTTGDAGDGPDADVDASADAGSTPDVTYQRAWQCSCGRCPSASEVCFALNTPGGLGGP